MIIKCIIWHQFSAETVPDVSKIMVYLSKLTGKQEQNVKRKTITDMNSLLLSLLSPNFLNSLSSAL